jgi:hypothetical protein
MTLAMKLRCPACKAPLEGTAVNVAKDVAYCSACESAWSCGELLRREEVGKLNLIDPPRGVEFERTPNGFILSATTRSPMAFFIVPFMTVWSGGSLGGIYGQQIAKGEFSLGMSLFGIPFLIASVLFWTAALMAVAGRVRVRVEGDKGEIFVGIGGLGRTKRFHWSAVRRVGSQQANVRYPGGQQDQLRVVLSDGRELPFGSGLNVERQSFVRRALEKLLLERELPEKLGPGTLSLPLEEGDEGKLSVVKEQGALSKVPEA